MSTTLPGADPLIGRTVSQYEVLAKLGGGGMGVVYSARDTKLGRLVALKFLPTEWTHDDTAKQRFIREAQAASATDHPNICTIYNIESTSEGQLFIVMAYYEGQTLKQKIEAGALEIDDAIDVAAQVAEGLAKAHAQGIIHRDIKPGNLIVTEHGTKILDFGLAKFSDAQQLTVAGSTLGTVAYMSPERSRGEEADARSDVWALGVVLYETLTGQLPFKGAYAEAISHAIRNDAALPLRLVRREIPSPVEKLVLRALEKDPNHRFQSAREMARELRQLQGHTIPLELRTRLGPYEIAGFLGAGTRGEVYRGRD
ncbi:MAG: serine/threonine protein kinase, partial [Acidobacteria bacterium]